MKKQFIRGFKQVVADRALLVALVALTMIVVAYLVYVVVMINPSELQVVTRYTTFGITNFYRDQWYYLLGFAGFGLMNLVMVPILAVKLLRLDYRQYAILFVWLAVFIMVVAWATAQSVLRLAALS